MFILLVAHLRNRTELSAPFLKFKPHGDFHLPRSIRASRGSEVRAATVLAWIIRGSRALRERNELRGASLEAVFGDGEPLIRVIQQVERFYKKFQVQLVANAEIAAKAGIGRTV